MRRVGRECARVGPRRAVVGPECAKLGPQQKNRRKSHETRCICSFIFTQAI